MTRHIEPGERIGALVTLRFYPPVVTPGKSRRGKWSCWCDCGALVFVDHVRLANVKYLSCGCRNRRGGHIPQFRMVDFV